MSSIDRPLYSLALEHHMTIDRIEMTVNRAVVGARVLVSIRRARRARSKRKRRQRKTKGASGPAFRSCFSPVPPISQPLLRHGGCFDAAHYLK